MARRTRMAGGGTGHVVNEQHVDLIRRALAAFEEAVDLPDDKRNAWLAEKRVFDPHLVTEVERLLMADAHGEHALPTGGLLKPLAPPPPIIGHYRVVERIGGGGMGEVFVGARADGLFDHLVAIKRMSPSLLPDAARALFDKERRALARLSHRHIAQLFDGGVDETGSPYLIMELVRGVPMDRHLAERDTPVRDIVGHVAAICDGVQHAHQHLIVHADLKPANVLVNEVGDAKIVDFGVARILREADSGEDIAIYPQTPAYASPQRRAGLSPSPSDDIYSLGVILRELLTGVPAALITNPAASASQTLKQHRPEDRSDEWIATRAQECAGDLDAIITRACEMDITRRYPSAGEMAEDLRAWLQYRPLKARRGETAYVIRKFIRRRRLRVIAGAVAAAGVIISLATVTVLYAQADYARRQAEQRFTEVRGLAKYLLYDVYDRLEQAPRTLAMRHDLTRVAQGYLDELAKTPSSPAEVKRDVIESFVRLAALQGGRVHSNLGRPAEAKATLDHAEKLLVELEKEGPLLPEDRKRRISINLLRTRISTNSEQNLVEAAKSLDAARAELKRLLPDEESLRLNVLAMVEATDLSNWNSAYAEAVANGDAGMALVAGLPENIRKSEEMRDALLRTMGFRGDAYYYLDRIDDAKKAYREISGIATDWLKEQPDNMAARRHVIVARWSLGTTYLAAGEPHAALRELNAAADLLPGLVEFEPTDDNAIRTEKVLLLSRAQALVATGQMKEGLASLQVQIDKRRQRYEEYPDVPEYARSYAIVLSAMADVLSENERTAEACPVYAQANALFEDLQRRGRVSSFDIDTGGWTMIKESIAKYCGAK